MDKTYKKQVWLNSEASSSIGSMVCYHATDKSGTTTEETSFIAVTDCFSTAKLHQAHFDSKEDFLNKVRLMRDTLTDYINHLETS